jgi:hypothetical protein
MLKKAGTVAAITAGLMLLGSTAFAEASAPDAVGRMGLLAPLRDFVVGSGVSDLNTLFGFAAFSSATGDNPSGYATFRNGGGDRSGEVTCLRVAGTAAVFGIADKRNDGTPVFRSSSSVTTASRRAVGPATNCARCGGGCPSHSPAPTRRSSHREGSS